MTSDSLKAHLGRIERAVFALADRLARLEPAGAQFGAQLMQRLDQLDQRQAGDVAALAQRLDQVDVRLTNSLTEEAASLRANLDQLVEDLAMLSQAILGYALVGGSITFSGLVPDQETHMIIIKDTQPNVAYTITPPTVTDARGRPVPNATLVYEVAATSDQPGGSGSIGVTPDPTNPLAGTVGPFNDNDDGSPAQVSVTVSVKLADGTLVGSFGEQFTVTAGDPASIVAGSISFAGLTSQP